ncbi:MAG: CYTH domain-containing protein [Patescibacteria group bacterium]|nr:CYTH domain-containing protein [Patescibacteria group bacterium]
MAIEFEATFPDIKKEEIRDRLKSVGAQLIHNEILQKRSNFYLPDKNEHSWVRVRDEGIGVVTMSYKDVPDKTDNINNQKEICIKIDNFENAKDFLINLGCVEKSYQETKRETWQLQGAEITIDEWPFLNPFVEIEAASEDIVKNVSEILNFDYQAALFCNVFYLYSQQYNIDINELKNRITKDLNKLTFSMANPFINFLSQKVINKF